MDDAMFFDVVVDLFYFFLPPMITSNGMSFTLKRQIHLKKRLLKKRANLSVIK